MSRSFAHEMPAAMAPTSVEALTVLVETIEKLSSTRTVEEIAAVVRSSARRLTGADGVAIVLRDEGRCHYVDEDAIGPLWKGLKFPMTACISGWAMLNKQTAVISDIYKDDRIPHDAYRPTFVKSLVMTPVRPEDPVAALGAYWATERAPDVAEVETLKAVARATATAFENVRLIRSLEEAAERREFLIHELDHRVKNSLASVQAIVRQSLKGAKLGAAFETTFDSRLKALSGVHELLTQRSWGAAQIGDLVEKALQPYWPVDLDRIAIGGPPVTLKPEAAVTLVMGLHELATNAVKYGALSNNDGKIRVAWTTPVADDEVRYLDFEWTETGGPPITTLNSPGAGMDLINRGLPRSLSGTATLEFREDGAHYRLIAPVSQRIGLA